MRILPDRFAVNGVERDYIVGALRGVHDPIDHQRRVLVLFERAGLEDPLQREIPGIRRGDLREPAVTLAAEIASIYQPILRLLIRAKDPLERNGRHGSLAVLT